MTTRKALLIAVPGEKAGKDYLPGAKADLYAHENHLLSNLGGAWEDSEIIKLLNPTRAAVLAAVKTIEKSTDYLYVGVAAHGFELKVLDRQDTVICLKGDDKVKLRELNPGNKRVTMIVDCCRKLERLTEARMALNYAKAAADNTFEKFQYRQLFDQALEACEYGTSTLYACGINEAADEDEDGGLFTSALFSCAKNFHTFHKLLGNTKIYDLWDVFHEASPVVTKRHPQQHPELKMPRMTKYYPFAVRP